MNKLRIYLKNLALMAAISISGKIIYEIAIYCGQTDPLTIWASNNPIEIVGTILFGAFLFSMHDWWLEKKAKSDSN